MARNPGTPSSSLANSTLCSRAPTSGKALTCWLAIPTAACTRGCTPPRIPTRWRAWSVVDSSHPEQYARLPQGRENYERSKQQFAGAPLLARVAVIRLFDLNPAPPSLPHQQRAQVDAFNSSTRQVSATTEEFRSTPETTAQVGRTGSLGDEPLAVVSAGKHLRGWLKLQGELAALHPTAATA